MPRKVRKNKLPYITQLIKRLASRMGARVVAEPEWGIVFQVIYKNGVVRSFWKSLLDLNGLGSSEVAGDKHYAKLFMQKRGYPVTEGQTVFEDNWAKTVGSNRKIPYALQYAAKLDYPVVVKPNDKSQGIDVYVVYNKKELVTCLKKIFKHNKVAIIERYMPGKDYRVVVLDGEVISACERIALSVTGDGKRSIAVLLKEKISFLLTQDIHIDIKDERIKLKLKHGGYTLGSVLQKGTKVFLLDNANLSSGGDAIDATKTISTGFKKIAINLTRDMGLRISGVDIMVTKGDLAQSPADCSYYIIEINSAPGLEPLESTYMKILKALGKKE